MTGFAPLVGERLTLRAMSASDRVALQELRRAPEIARWWGAGPAGWPHAEAGQELLVIEVDGRVAGHIELYEELDPDWRWASLDVFVAPDLIGRGYGTEALRLIVDHLIAARGHHRITIDPAVDNAPAIRSYEKVGFTPVGRMRSCWRDGDGRWRDGLLMELVVEPR